MIMDAGYLDHVEQMIAEGADIIDIGGESTRPGYTKISDEEEISRVLPVIEAVKKRFDIPVSLDTYKSSVAKAGLEAGVDLSVFFQKKIASGLFGGEGFIMQKVSGQGIVFAEFDGHVVEYELRADQQIVVDTGYLAAMSASCGIEIQTVPGIKNMVFGGEGLFNTVITGPGHVWLQTMPLSNVAGVLRPYFPSSK